MNNNCAARSIERCEYILKEILHLELSQEIKINALTLILKILNNIINNPDDPKYRYVKRTSVSYTTKILLDGISSGHIIESLLLCCGFNIIQEEEEEENNNNITTTVNDKSSLELDRMLNGEDLIQFRNAIHLQLSSIENGSAETNTYNNTKPCSPDSLEQSKLKTLRELQAERYQQKLTEKSNNSTNSPETNCTDDVHSELLNNNGRNSSQRGILQSFFSSLFGSGDSRHNRNNGSTNNRPRIQTVRDLPRLPQRGG